MPWWGWVLIGWIGVGLVLAPIFGKMLKRSREAMEAATYETAEEWLEAQKEVARERSRQRAWLN